MNHLDEEQLIEHYYGDDGGAAELHLAECPSCREAYASLQVVLNTAGAFAVLEPGPDYEQQVWNGLEPRLPMRRRGWLAGFGWHWAAVAAVSATLLGAAFLAGRMYPLPSKQPLISSRAVDPGVRDAVLAMAVGDYLERSQMVLIELANASAARPLDITAEQERAADLVDEARLYRQTAAHAGDAGMVSVLDDLERVLLEIAHAPARMTPEDVTRLREKVRTEGILFKIRVLGSNVRNWLEPGTGDSGRQL